MKKHFFQDVSILQPSELLEIFEDMFPSTKCTVQIYNQINYNSLIDVTHISVLYVSERLYVLNTFILEAFCKSCI